MMSAVLFLDLQPRSDYAMLSSVPATLQACAVLGRLWNWALYVQDAQCVCEDGVTAGHLVSAASGAVSREAAGRGKHIRK